MSTPRAGSTRRGSSLRSGQAKARRPEGISPITFTEYRSSRSNTITVAVARTKASNGPGTYFGTVKRKTSTTAESSTVGV
jgi:hypothetical protein